MSILKNLIAGKSTKVPIWFMRQAGRYMGEYRQIRATEPDFLSLCYKTDKVTEITMQPIKRFDFDCAIIFSDILVLPDLLGWPVEFQKGEGPVLQKFTNKHTLKDFSQSFDSKFDHILKAISQTRQQLSPEKSLIGFADVHGP